MDKPLISIIMPAYNAEKYIDESIQSIIDQTYKNWELLICDDRSNDKTKYIIGQYKDRRIKKYENDTNIGYLKTCNRMLSLCSGDYITFQDADDISVPERLSTLLAAFFEDNSLGLVGSWAHIVNEKGRLIRCDERPEGYEKIKKMIASRNAFCGATVMIKKEVYNNIGGYREYFHRLAYQDYDWTYLICDSYKCINLAKPLYKWRQHSQSTSKIIDPKRFVSDKLVRHLGEQRKESKLDDLQRGDIQSVDNYLTKQLLPYIEDPTLVYRDYAAMYMYLGLKLNAISVSWTATKKKPLKIKNWRTLLYCIRKFLINEYFIIL